MALVGRVRAPSLRGPERLVAWRKKKNQSLGRSGAGLDTFPFGSPRESPRAQKPDILLNNCFVFVALGASRDIRSFYFFMRLRKLFSDALLGLVSDVLLGHLQTARPDDISIFSRPDISYDSDTNITHIFLSPLAPLLARDG